MTSHHLTSYINNQAPGYREPIGGCQRWRIAGMGETDEFFSLNTLIFLKKMCIPENLIKHAYF